MSFESEKLFNDFQHFARGIRRSGEFSIKESQMLEQCGTVMMELHLGQRKPADKVEKEFLEQLHSDDVITNVYAKVFKKYLKVIQPRRLHRLCTVGDEDIMSNDLSGSADSSIE